MSPTKTHPDIGGNPDAFWSKMGGMLGAMEARLTKETESVRDTLGQAIGDLRSRADKTERRLDGLVGEVHAIVEEKLARSVGEPAQLGVQTSDGASCAQEDSQPLSYASAAAKDIKTVVVLSRKAEKRGEEIYWDCRRAVRLRPILDGDDRVEVERFLTEHLRLDDGQIDSLGPFSVRRVPYGRLRG